MSVVFMKFDSLAGCFQVSKIKFGGLDDKITEVERKFTPHSFADRSDRRIIQA